MFPYEVLNLVLNGYSLKFLKFFDEPELKNKVEMIWKEIGEEGLELRVITYVNEIVLIFQVVI